MILNKHHNNHFIRFMKIKQISKLLIISALIFLVWAILIILNPIKPKQLVFDAERWKADKSECSFYFKGDRQYMIKDLQQFLSQQRFNRPMVEELLGDALFFQDENSWSYYAGTSTMDCQSFDITFDDNGYLIKTELVQH
jgi:hypothetical protein